MVEPGEIIVEAEDFEQENGGRSCNYRLLKLLMQTGIPSNKEAHRKMAQGVVWFTEYGDDHQECLTQLWNDCLVPVLGGETLKVGRREYRIWRRTQLSRPRPQSDLSKKFERKLVKYEYRTPTCPEQAWIKMSTKPEPHVTSSEPSVAAVAAYNLLELEKGGGSMTFETDPAGELDIRIERGEGYTYSSAYYYMSPEQEEELFQFLLRRRNWSELNA